MIRMVKTFMHRPQRRNRGLMSLMAILPPVVLILMVALVPPYVGSRASVAAIGPLVVSGTVMDSGGAPVVGASVVVTILNGVTPRAILPTTSVAAGFYTVSFGNGDWDTGNTIFVAASFNSQVGENSTIADEADPFPIIDVHLGSTVIPELGGPATTILAVSGIGMLVVVYARRRGSGAV